MNPDAESSLNGRGSKKFLSGKKTQFHGRHDLSLKYKEALTPQEDKLLEITAEVSALMQTPVSKQTNEMLDRLVELEAELTVRQAEQALLQAERNFGLEMDVNPVVAEAVQEWLPREAASDTLELWLADSLDQYEQTVDADSLQTVATELIAVAISASHPPLTAPDLMPVSEAIIAKLDAEHILTTARHHYELAA